MKSSNNQTKAIYIAIHLVLLIIVQSCSANFFALEVLSIIVPTILLYTDIKAQNRVFTLYNIFIIILSIFHFGEYWLSLFHIPIDISNGHDIFSIYSASGVLSSASFALSSMLFLNCAGLCTLKKAVLLHSEPVSFKDYKIAKVIFFCLLPLMIYNDFDRIILTQTFSYSEAVYMSSFLSRFETCFIIAALFLIYDKTKLSKYILIYLVFRAIILMAFTGSRIGMIIELILFLYTWFRKIEISTKRVVGLGFLAYIGLVVVGYIKQTRGFLQISIGDFVSQGGLLSSQLSEFGSTMETLTLAIEHDSTVGGLSGLTYLSAILTIIPFSTALFPFITHYRVAHDFLNPYAPSVGALGGSFFAEQYMNWGEMGMLVSLVFGVLFARLQNTISVETKPFKSILCITLFYGVLIYSRANMYDFVACACGLLYYIVLYFILNKIIKG